MSSEHRLNEPWVTWMHSSNTNADWSLQSYNIVSISSQVEELWATWKTVHDYTKDAMFFFMKGEYPPRWDEVQYQRGGYISLRVDAASANKVIEEVICKVAGLTIMDDESSDAIVGVSTSSKGRIMIIKLWCTTPDVQIEKMNLAKRLKETARFTAFSK